MILQQMSVEDGEVLDRQRLEQIKKLASDVQAGQTEAPRVSSSPATPTPLASATPAPLASATPAPAPGATETNRETPEWRAAFGKAFNSGMTVEEAKAHADAETMLATREAVFLEAMEALKASGGSPEILMAKAGNASKTGKA
jgi:hypothetical protein